MDETQTRQQLVESGMTVRQIAAAVHRGDLIRVRRGHYATPGVSVDAQRAVRVGGRLACVSELRHLGAWVLDEGRVHVHVAPNAARLRDPDDRTRRLGHNSDCVVHWAPLDDAVHASSSHVSVVDALTQAIRCVERRAAQATIDSCVRLGLVTAAQLALVARAVDAKTPLVADASAESGLESIVRVLVSDLGLRCDTQVEFFGGHVRVDLLVDGWIAVETDGHAFHDAAVTTRDRRRDARLTKHGVSVLRFRYAQVVYELPAVAHAIIGAVEAHRRVRNSGQKARMARRRARKLGLT